MSFETLPIKLHWEILFEQASSEHKNSNLDENDRKVFGCQSSPETIDSTATKFPLVFQWNSKYFENFLQQIE